MKKLLFTVTLLTFSLYLTACGSKESNTGTTETTVEAETATKDLPDGDYSDTGEGTMHLATAGGTSENGNVPVVYAAADTSLLQIGLNASDFNGSNLSYIYIDGYLLDKQQLADSQITLTLEKNNLAVGVHKVEVVQYENDDTASTMTTYKTASYEIKAK